MGAAIKTEKLRKVNKNLTYKNLTSILQWDILIVSDWNLGWFSCDVGDYNIMGLVLNVSLYPNNTPPNNEIMIKFTQDGW